MIIFVDKKLRVHIILEEKGAENTTIMALTLTHQTNSCKQIIQHTGALNRSAAPKIFSVGLWGFQPLQRPRPYITKPLILIVSKFANWGDLAIWKNNTVLLSSNDIHSPPRPVLWPTHIFQQSFCWSKPFLTLKVLALRVKTVNALHTG